MDAGQLARAVEAQPAAILEAEREALEFRPLGQILIIKEAPAHAKVEEDVAAVVQLREKILAPAIAAGKAPALQLLCKIGTAYVFKDVADIAQFHPFDALMQGDPFEMLLLGVDFW